MKKLHFSEKDIDQLEKELTKNLFRKRVVYYYRRLTRPPYTKLEKGKFYCWTNTEQNSRMKALRDLGYNDFICHLLHPRNKPDWYKEKD
jgi:hypothetical protein